MICLGIDGTAHTFSVGIVNDDGKILSNERSVYKPPLGKGIIPNDALEHHKRNCEIVLQNALTKANLKIGDVDILAYSAGPGIPPPLIFTADFALELSKKINKPLIPVNHCIAHLEIGKLTTKTNDPLFVYLSGGNTQIIALVGGKYRIFGETQDISVGNSFDTVARELALPMPGGPEIEKLAKQGKYVDLPYVVKGMDVSLTGITTAAIKKFKEGVPKSDICYSLQETCFAMLVEITERAVAHTGKEEILLVGGVAANKRLQEMLKNMCNERGCKFYVVPQEYSGDQGAMIAWTGLLEYKSGWGQKMKNKVNPNWRIDDAEVNWT